MTGLDEQLLVFSLDRQRCALRLSQVDSVVRAVAIDPLPKAPAIVLGVINVRGRVIPVVSLRQRFKMPEREIELADHIILARTSCRTVALVVDSVGGTVAPTKNDVVAAERILPGLEHCSGVLKLSDGLIIVHDLERFLSLEEEQALAEAMAPESEKA